jgi:hypothetical protein
MDVAPVNDGSPGDCCTAAGVERSVCVPSPSWP